MSPLVQPYKFLFDQFQNRQKSDHNFQARPSDKDILKRHSSPSTSQQTLNLNNPIPNLYLFSLDRHHTFPPGRVIIHTLKSQEQIFERNIQQFDLSFLRLAFVSTINFLKNFFAL